MQDIHWFSQNNKFVKKIELYLVLLTILNIIGLITFPWLFCISETIIPTVDAYSNPITSIITLFMWVNIA